MGELAYGATPEGNEPGDVGGVSWIRYDDPEVKKFKLNAERNNGRAAMMVHNALGVDALSRSCSKHCMGSCRREERWVFGCARREGDELSKLVTVRVWHGSQSRWTA